MSIWTEQEERLVTLQARAERRRKRRHATLQAVLSISRNPTRIERWRAFHREADTLARKLWQLRVEEGTRRMALRFRED